MNIVIKSHKFELVKSRILFQIINAVFLDKNVPKTTFPVQKQTFEHHHQIQHIRISPGTKFHIKQAILILWTKFVQKGYFPSKARQMNITIEFRISELV